ncbi:MAG: SDR family oxidoreductase [Anaerolineae bacterium]|nr:SDR family oxidoreductase [Anaerolineae bacterium]
MMLGYAEMRDLRRVLVPVPVLTPRLSSYWVHWMTPIPAEIARPLIEGLRNEVVVRDDTARDLLPGIEPLDYRTAVNLALSGLEAGQVETTWSDALASSQGDASPVVPGHGGGHDHGAARARSGRRPRRGSSRSSPGWEVNAAGLASTGRGNCAGCWTGWWAAWGFRRGRRHPDAVRVGDALDFWRVEVVGRPAAAPARRDEGARARVAAMGGTACRRARRSRLVQTAFFAPKGLAGLLYWYVLYPIHGLIFSGMVRRLAEQAEANQGDAPDHAS